MFATISLSERALLLLLPQQCTDAVDVASHDRPGDIALESDDAMIAADIETMHLQRVDRRFHCGVRAPGFDKACGLLDLLRTL